MPCCGYSAQQKAMILQRELTFDVQDVSNKNTVEDVLNELAKERPALAKKLRALDWNDIVKYVARQALESAAKKLGAEVMDEYAKPSQAVIAGGMPAGECVGVIKRNGIQVGVSVNGTSITTFVDDYNRGMQETDQLRQSFAAAYREEATKAVLSLLGGQVSEERTADGVIVFKTTVHEGGKH